MTFLILLVAATIAYLVWRISDQLPDLMFRLGEIQRDVADIREAIGDSQGASTSNPTQATAAPTTSSTPANDSTDSATGADTRPVVD